MNSYALGLGGSDHEFSAALMRGQDILIAIEQERLSRRKHGFSYWYEDPVKKSIDYCLGSEGLSLADVDEIVSSDILPVRVRHNLKGHSVKLYPHHLCHAASAYLMLPPMAQAGVIVYDGFGSIRGTVPDEADRNYRETFSFFVFGPDGYKCLGSTVGLGFIEDDYQTSVTNSVGLFYELITSLLGNHPLDCGKTMGLASHGVPRYLDVLENFVSYGDDASACFNCDINNPELVTAVNKILLSSRHSFTVKADLAASVQVVINKTLLHCEKFFGGQKIEYLCISGGCGLNTVANSFLVENSTLDVPKVIPPHCGDAGIAFGALWLNRFHKTDGAPRITFRGGEINPGLSRPGRVYSSEECRQAIQEFYPRLVLDASVKSGDYLARLLAAGEIIAVFNGRSEIGPRALGGRSIIADPSSVMIREKINRQIKKREAYRPFAPMVLESNYDEYFEDSRQADQYMLKVARGRERCRREAPAVVHVDGTARVQVVTEDSGDPFLIELLRAFQQLTGRSLLLNTSFNRQGEPIVESPLDAVDAFLGLGLDGLYLESNFYRSADSVNPRS